MRCPACATDSPGDGPACSRCGGPLERVCAACGHATPVSFRFCGACGATLGAQPPPDDTDPAERRQLSVLFADLVGSTALAERLDPEDLRDVMRLYTSLCIDVVARYGGVVAEVAGDGTIAYFGHPQAYEDAAERAVLAGLALIEAVRRAQLSTRIEVRVGVASGLMIVGDMIETDGIRQREIVGSPANLAARLQKLAAPGTVVIGASTRRLVGGAFNLVDLGTHQLDGFDVGVEAFAVTGSDSTASRFEVRAGRQPPPLVDREAERALLEESWRDARLGRGRVILLAGEPGIGKSRLVRELEGRLAGEPHARFAFAGSPLHRHTPFFAIVRQLRAMAGIEAADTLAQRREKLVALFPDREGLSVPGGLALLAATCGSPAALAEAATALTPGHRRAQLLEVMQELLVHRAARGPVLLVFEDLQWLDATTGELLDRLIRRAARSTMLIVVTFRTGFDVAWHGLPHVRTVTLQPLLPSGSRGVIAGIARNRRLSAEETEAIVLRADGVPLFVEELTKAVIEARDKALPAGVSATSRVPETLRDALMARLDRHADARTVAQIAAAIGREFSYELLALITPLAAAALNTALDELLFSELIFQHGPPPRTTYVFKHALVQDIAYDSLLRRRRRAIHRQIAAALAKHFPETPPDVRGHHQAAAGEIELAVSHFERAAELARDRSATAEAAAHYRRALDLLATLPPGPERDRRELHLQIGLGAQLVALEGNAASSVGQAYRRAMALCRTVGEPRQIFRVLRGLQTFHIVRGQLREARPIGERLLEEARAAGDDDLLLQAHRPHGLCLIYMGELSEGRHHSARAIELYDPVGHASHRFLYNSDPGVLAYCTLAWAEWLLGAPQRARRYGDTALRLARRPEPHPHSQGFALSFIASLAQFESEPERACEAAGSVIALAERWGFAYWRAWGHVIRGWGRAILGDAVGLAECRDGVSAYRDTEAGLMVPYFLGLQAEAAARAGLVGDGLAALDLGLAQAKEGDIRFYVPELLRLRAVLQTAAGVPIEVRMASLRAAVAEARAQGSRSFELRALTTLCRGLGDDEERAVALAQLRGALAGFEEPPPPRLADEAHALLGTAA